MHVWKIIILYIGMEHKKVNLLMEFSNIWNRLQSSQTNWEDLVLKKTFMQMLIYIKNNVGD